MNVNLVLLQTCSFMTSLTHSGWEQEGVQWSSGPGQETPVSVPSNIQGVTGGTDQTSGECSFGQTIPI
jgi:hypothetical protein